MIIPEFSAMIWFPRKNQQMRICMVTNDFNCGGGIEHIFQVVKGLPSFEFHIYGRSGDSMEKFAALPNAVLFPHGFRPAKVIESQPDLIHVHHLRSLFSFFLNPFARYRVPLVYTAHGVHVHGYEFSRGPAAALKSKMRSGLETYLLRRCERVIAVSDDDLQFMKSRYGLNHTVHIPNGIDPAPIDSVAPEREKVGQEFGFPAGCFLFVTIARFHFQKGYDVLIRAVAHESGFFRSRNVRFLLVGDGATLPECRRLAGELRVEDLVCFAGRRADAYRLLKSADALVLPSRWEGLPLVLLEAGLAKVPVVATKACGNRELLEGDRGLLAENENSGDLAEKLRAALEGRHPLDRYAENLYRTIRSEYSLERMLALLEETYISAGMGKAKR